MPSKKHYIITSITLGAIAASSALLIGLTNLATRNAIAQNEIKKITGGIVEIYGENASISETKAIEGEYKYLQELYVVQANSQDIGYAYKTSGSNMYGKISLIIGFANAGHNFLATTIVVNEQTYASTLVDNYIDPVNAGDRDYYDVSCGATYGANLVRDMINEASDHVEELWGKNG